MLFHKCGDCLALLRRVVGHTCNAEVELLEMFLALKYPNLNPIKSFTAYGHLALLLWHLSKLETLRDCVTMHQQFLAAFTDL